MKDFEMEWILSGQTESKLKTYTLIITPDMAADMLKHRNPNNRSLNSHRVAQYKYSMEHGDWVENPDGIAFDEEGVLINGHTRLNAIIAAGTS